MSQGNGSDVIATIRALEAQAADFERNANELRAVANNLRSLLGGADAAIPQGANGNGAGANGAVASNPAGRTPATGTPAPTDKKFIAEAARDVLVEAGGPLHHTELSTRLQRRGIALPDDPERRRLNFVHVASRFPSLIRPAGNGRYAAGPGGAVMPGHAKGGPVRSVNLARVMSGQAGSVGGRGDTTNMVVTFLEENSGLPSNEVAKQLAPHVTSGAKDPRKLIHSTLHYLTKQGRVRKSADGKLYLVHQTNNGQEPRLALDR